MTEITEEVLREALHRIATTSDGELLYRYLQKALCRVAAGAAEHGALAMNEGRRIFAAELMGLMSGGIRVRDAVVCFSVAERKPDAGAVFKPRPGGRRISADTYVAGFDGPADQFADDARPGYPAEQA